MCLKEEEEVSSKEEEEANNAREQRLVQPRQLVRRLSDGEWIPNPKSRFRCVASRVRRRRSNAHMRNASRHSVNRVRGRRRRFRDAGFIAETVENFKRGLGNFNRGFGVSDDRKEREDEQTRFSRLRGRRGDGIRNERIDEGDERAAKEC